MMQMKIRRMYSSERQAPTNDPCIRLQLFHRFHISEIISNLKF